MLVEKEPVSIEGDFVPQVRDVPLVVDLDGTLLRSDLLVESVFAHVAAHPGAMISTARAFLRGKAAFKAHVSDPEAIDAASLPYCPDILRLIAQAHAEGRPLYLASASNERLVRAVADHLGLFDGWFASTADRNLASRAKAARLVEEFGAQGFDYVGNSDHDIAVWQHARKAVGVRVGGRVERRLRALPDAHVVATPPAGLRPWLKLLRVHQYVKNALVFVPMLAAHQFSLGSLTLAAVAFVAFSLCASCVYIVNDMADLAEDRRHPTKRLRALAAGTVSINTALLVAPLLLLAAFALAASVSWPFTGVLALYFALTTAYSFSLKRKMLVDVVALAMLYALRVLGGAAILAIQPSEWLLAFSILMFTALALIKRYTELAVRLDRGMSDPSTRNYRIADLPVVATLAAAAGINAVTVFALYISSASVAQLYTRPYVLWLVPPALLYWIMRMLLLAHRRYMNDDPVVFAMRDRNSFWVLLFIGAGVLLAL